MINCNANKTLVAKLRKTGHLVASEAHGSCKRTSGNLLLIFKRNSRLRPGKFDGTKLTRCNRPQTCFCLFSFLCQTNSENEIKLSRAFEKCYRHKTLRQSCFWLKYTWNISRSWHVSVIITSLCTGMKISNCTSFYFSPVSKNVRTLYWAMKILLRGSGLSVLHMCLSYMPYWW